MPGFDLDAFVVDLREALPFGDADYARLERRSNGAENN